MEENNWHIKKWHLLGWLETLIKSLAIIIGIYVLFIGFTKPAFLRLNQLPLIELIILTILSLGLLAAIYNRYQLKDIISMVFVIFNNLGHWGLIYGILKGANIKFLYSFVLIMLAGDIVKIVFLKRHNYSEGDMAPQKFIYLTSVYALGYLVIFLFGLPTLI